MTNNPSLWHLLVILTIVIGVTVTVLALNKEKYFPSLYAHSDSAVHHKSDMHAESALQELPAEVSEPGKSEIEEKPSLPSQESKPAAGKYVLVAGSFLSEEYARKYQSSLREKLPDIHPEIVQVMLESSTYYRVVALYGRSKSNVLSAKRSIEEAGYPSTWFFKQ